MFARYVGSRIADVGEDYGRAAEDVVLDGHPVVDAHVVLDAHATPHDDGGGHVHVLSERAARANPRVRADVGEVPDLGAVADFARLVDDRRGMHEDAVPRRGHGALPDRTRQSG